MCLGTDLALGVSVETAEQASAAEAAGADYLGVTVFPTRTKPEAVPGGLGRVREISAATRLPVTGIGGIDASNARQVLEAGAAGVAVVAPPTRPLPPGPWSPPSAAPPAHPRTGAELIAGGMRATRSNERLVRANGVDLCVESLATPPTRRSCWSTARPLHAENALVAEGQLDFSESGARRRISAYDGRRDHCAWSS
jgi:hypothetical protein